MPVVVGDANVNLPPIDLQPGGRINGRIVFDGSSQPTAEDRRQATVGLARADGTHGMGAPVVRMGRDTFTTSTFMPGRYVLRVGNPSDRWSIRAVTMAGRDITGLPVDVGVSDVIDVTVTLSDRATTIEGTVTMPSGQLESDVQVVVFPADRQRWTDYGGEGRTASTMPVTKGGTFSVQVLPGDYFVLATTTDLGDRWRAPAILSRLSAFAQRINVQAGQRASLSIRAQDVR
jgi:hypothetical protein